MLLLGPMWPLSVSTVKHSGTISRKTIFFYSSLVKRQPLVPFVSSLRSASSYFSLLKNDGMVAHFDLFIYFDEWLACRLPCCSQSVALGVCPSWSGRRASVVPNSHLLPKQSGLREWGDCLSRLAWRSLWNGSRVSLCSEVQQGAVSNCSSMPSSADPFIQAALIVRCGWVVTTCISITPRIVQNRNIIMKTGYGNTKNSKNLSNMA